MNASRFKFFRTRFRTAIILLAFCFAPVCAVRAQVMDDKEAKLKTAFVLKFALYVEWPQDTFGSPTNPIVFGVFGRDPFGPTFDATMQGQTLDKHPVEVRHPRNLTEALECHVLFISASERDRLRTLVPRLRTRPILTVSDMDGFAALDGMIGLKRKQGAMRFDINRHAAEAAGLKISSKLLNLADELK